MKTILVVEDEKVIRENIVKILTHSGFQAIYAANGIEGIDMAIAHHPDLIICDIMMPGRDGYDVLTTLRQHEATTLIPFIFLSAKVDKSDIRQGMNLGADDYLTKPFTSAELVEAVRARINRQDAIAQPYKQEMRRAAENLNHLAFYDILTDLPNLILFHQRLQDHITHVQRKPQAMLAVLRIRLLPRNWIEKAYHQPLADSLLRAIANRLKAFTQTDTDEHGRWAARVGSSEFALMLPNILVPEDVIESLDELISSLEMPYEIDHQLKRLVAKVGIALFPENGATASALLSHAEIAVHQCLADETALYCFYTSDMADTHAQRKRLLADLESAFERSEFHLVYQPQVNLVSERIVGVEALLRWQHSELGAIAPDQFIPLLEEAELLSKFGEWIIQTACQQMTAWRSLTLVPLHLSINLWPQQIQNDTFLDQLLCAIRHANLNPNQIVVDISEPCLMALEFDDVIRIFNDIAATGIQIAIDGFGMHSMPLQHLKHLPIHMLKLDKSFIDHVVDDERDAIITEAIIAMAQSLKLKVLAKGIETDAQLNILTRHGCHMMQGYLYSPPLSPDDMEKVLTTGSANTVGQR